MNSVGVIDEKYGALALSHFSGKGAVELFKNDEVALLMEYVAGTSLLSLVENGEDQSATLILADVLNELHTAPLLEKKGLTPLSNRFRSLLNRAMLSDEDPIFYLAAKIAKKLLSTQTPQVILHGDVHHENVLQNLDRGWLAIDPI